MLEQTFELDKEPAPLLVHDFQVIAHLIYEDVKKLIVLYSRELWEKVVRAHWALRINRGPDCLPLHPHYRVIMVDDLRFKDIDNYWRGKEIANDERMDLVWEVHWEKNQKKKPKNFSEVYKGNRGKKLDDFLRVCQIGSSYVKEYFSMHYGEGFEADDIASSIYRYSRDRDSVCRERQVLFHTIDRDWGQLVSDEHRCYWLNTRYPRSNEKIQHRMAGNAEIVEHTLHKYNVEISHPRELIQVKSFFGDLGDNLPPGSPREYMDLCEPPEQWRFETKEAFAILEKEINNPEPRIYLDHFKKAYRALEKLHIIPFGFWVN